MTRGRVQVSDYIVQYYDGYYVASGGIEGYLTDLMCHLEYHFLLVTDRFPREIELQPPHGRVAIHRTGPTNLAVSNHPHMLNGRPFFPLRLVGDILRVKRKLRLLRTLRPQAIQVHGLGVPGTILRSAFFVSPREIVREFSNFSRCEGQKIGTMHGLLSYLGTERIRSMEREFYSHFETIVCVDANLIDYVRNNWPEVADSSSLFLVQQSVDMNLFTYSPPDSGPPCIGFLGRLERSRGIEYLTRLSHNLPDGVRLHVIGSGSRHEIARFEEAIDRRRTTAAYNLSRREVAKELRRIHVLFNPVLVDGISRATLEAMATGRPVIMFSAPHRYPVIAPENGFLIPKSHEEISSLVADIAKMRYDLITMGRKARLIVEAEFSATSFKRKWNEIYSKVGVKPAASGDYEST